MLDGLSAGETLAKGVECLLNVTGRHFKVTVQSVQGDWVRVSFPAKDYPVPGMSAVLEFHDEVGFTYYTTIVESGPPDAEGAIALRLQGDAQRSTHRGCYRASTDLTVHVREQNHVRQYDASLVNISGGGGLIRTCAEFDYTSVVEVTLSLPGESTFMVQAQVVHVDHAPNHGDSPSRYYGLRFVDVEPDVEQAITRYMWDRLRELYPSGVG
ncbi:MAG: hypothetical protein GWP08_04795 [Nitrospiraceae bacterium]|nr:hypothetical protein [Nitrospiraceae bacterium]